MRRKKATAIKKVKYSNDVRSKKRTDAANTGARKNRKSELTQREKYYRGIQHLLVQKGYYPSIAQLRTVPFQRLLMYIQDNFSRELISQYLPLTLVYNNSQASSSAEQTKPSQKISTSAEQTKTSRKISSRERRTKTPQKISSSERRTKTPRKISSSERRTKTPEKKSHTVSKRAKKQAVEIQLPVYQPEPPTYPETMVYQPQAVAQKVDDINQPAPLSEEVLANSPQTQMVNAIFTFEDSHPFDPGLWSSIVEKIPQGYAIPDSEFTSRLQMAQEEIMTASLSGVYEPLTPDSEI